ncbi:acyl-CoA dehydrogenase [Nocardia neocaledoniensis NBRC 108232]|uniref:Aminoglycoside phosphotransferase (APT) family kinase protein n=1 Tax=Nocardia neocaledoniensis TaxID=236511 RepID=A0A317N3S9_9NOCA|nr:phosphotransferase family protein [Nocardia neocaledoniensis]PWV69896.1 aminoglycoside phosphotransferase (APT) family kinase protein [Nocardia neocaledoniensis]GEM31414.1 acyl-CoA dehydrogenase [Nocardia neocaledoniensis NBRC 108232]
MATGTELPGLDLDRLGPWLRAAVPGVGADLTGRVLAGGRSNLTYTVSDGASSWIVRRPPLGHVLATAHDMAREYRVMAALRQTSVPVPAMYALCEDAEVIGAPFYVMELVAGRPYRHAAELAELGSERTQAMSAALVDTLADLHAVDPAAVGLADFGRPEGFLTRQVSRWKKQLDASRTRDLPLADELHALLAADVPAESTVGIVHGDYRLDNVLVDDRDRPAAVIDWEMATLGDPLTDLALMVVYGRLAAQLGRNAVVADATSAPGFLSEDEIIARYTARSDRDMSRFGFYLGLAAFKLAVIIEGIHYRFLRGQTVGAGFDALGDAVEPLLDTGRTALKEHR